MRQMAIGAAVVAAAALLGTGCGGSAHRALPTVSVTERDFAIHAPRLVPAGDVRFVVRNEGPVDHELLVVRANGRLPRRSDGFTIAEESLTKSEVTALEPEGPGCAASSCTSRRAGTSSSATWTVTPRAE